VLGGKRKLPKNVGPMLGIRRPATRGFCIRYYWSKPWVTSVSLEPTKKLEAVNYEHSRSDGISNLNALYDGHTRIR
jgi:hypothetical protein